jgi:RNA polymerase sigma-70 factor (ECF subfamily)
MLGQGMTAAVAGSLPAVADERRPLSSAEFERRYNEHARPLWGYLRRMTGSATEADDLLQKSFLRLLEAQLPPLDDVGFRRYLYRLATNIAIDEHRSRRDHELRPLEAIAVESDAILRADMQRLFERLKPRERALLWLAHVEEYEHGDLAVMLGVGSGSVKVLLFRARKKLQKLIEREWKKERKR